MYETNAARIFCAYCGGEKLYKGREKLFISQPALSKSIRALEAELGVTLFKRDPRELSLTSEGENVYCYAVDILNYWQSRTAELFSLLEQVKGSLRFGLPPSVGSVFFQRFCLNTAVNIRRLICRL